MPKNPNPNKRPVGIPVKTYLEIEEYANKCNPQLFLFEVVELAWDYFKKENPSMKKSQ